MLINKKASKIKKPFHFTSYIFVSFTSIIYKSIHLRKPVYNDIFWIMILPIDIFMKNSLTTIILGISFILFRSNTSSELNLTFICFSS